MPTKVNSAGEQQEYDASTGRYGKGTSSPRDYDKEIADLKEQASKLSLFNPKRHELGDKISQLEAEKEGYASYDEMKKAIAKKNEEKNKRYEEYKKKYQEQEQSQDYMMSHRPTETGITADNLTNQDVELAMPDNYYDILEKEAKYDDDTRESLEQLKRVRNNPDAEITIYRATVGDKINDGDWITLSPTYAKKHNEHSLDGKGKVLSMKVKAKDIQMAGDSIQEWGYFPNKFENGLRKGLNLK